MHLHAAAQLFRQRRLHIIIPIRFAANFRYDIL